MRIQDAAPSYGEQLRQLEATGQTALGPALLVANGMIAGAAPGARIVLCTDGCSNVGVGGLVTDETGGRRSLADFLPGLESCRQFYKTEALRARERGATVSVISIEGEHSNLQALGVVADITGGTIQRVQPIQLAFAFETCVFQELVATRVDVHVRLHTR
jgi:Mg-chelatase subunit ChlD